MIDALSNTLHDELNACPWLLIEHMIKSSPRYANSKNLIIQSHIGIDLPNGIPYPNTSCASITNIASTERMIVQIGRKKARIITNEFSHASCWGNIEKVIVHAYRVSIMDKILALIGEMIANLRLSMNQVDDVRHSHVYVHTATI